METWLVIEGCKNLYGATDHQPLVTNIGKKSVADVSNKRLARLKEKTMSGDSI